MAALLHDVGKPFCTLRDGDSHDHAEEGARIAGDILKRLKAPKHVAAETADLVLWHMYDFDCRAKENKLRRFFVRQADLLEKLMLLKQADYSGCMDDLSPALPIGNGRLCSKKCRENVRPCGSGSLPCRDGSWKRAGFPPACFPPSSGSCSCTARYVPRTIKKNGCFFLPRLPCIPRWRENRRQKAADGFSFYRTGAADCSPVCHPKTPTKSG
ncbi:MAG: HD domain-containing protein [Christensenellaceae bacterium]